MSDLDEVAIEQTPLDICSELIDHLGIPESCMTLFRERFDGQLLSRDKDERFAADVLAWVMEFIHDYNKAPSTEAVHLQFGGEWPFQQPKESVQYLIAKYRERYRRQEVQALVKTLARTVNSDPNLAAETGLTGFQNLQVTTSSRRARMDTSDWRTWFSDYEIGVEEGRLHGITFGFKDMDHVLGGLRKDGLYYVIGRPKRYKSWMLMKSAVEAQEQGHRVAFFSLELTHHEMYGRYLAMKTGLPWSGLQHGTLMQRQLEDARQTMESMEEVGHFDCMHPPVEQCTVPELVRQAQEIDADVVYIDQLKFVKSTQKVSADLRHREVEYVNEDLKRAAENFPIYVAAQFNREAAALTEMADLAKIGLSDSIGQTADMLLGLHAGRDMMANGQIEFGTIESRSFEHARWLISVELSTHSNFRLVERSA